MADSAVDAKNVVADAPEVCELSAEKKTVPVVEKVAADNGAEVVVAEPEGAEKANDAAEEVAAGVVDGGVSETDSCKLKEKPKNGIAKNGLDAASAEAAAAAATDAEHAENGDSQDDLIHEIKVTDVSGEDNSNDVCSLKRKSLTADSPAEKKRKTAAADENDHDSVVVEVKNGSEKVV